MSEHVRQFQINPFGLKRSYQDMLAFIAVLSKVQIVLNGVRLVGGKLDLHVKLTPTFLCNAERWLFEDYLNQNSQVSVETKSLPLGPSLR